MNSIYDDIGQTCILLYYACILRTMIKLCKKQYQNILDIHTREIWAYY